MGRLSWALPPSTKLYHWYWEVSTGLYETGVYGRLSRYIHKHILPIAVGSAQLLSRAVVILAD